MKILCISNLYPPYFEGGYEISVKETMDFLSEQGHEVYVLCGYKGVETSTIPNLAIERDAPLRILRYINYHEASIRNKHEVEKFNYLITCQVLDLVKPEIVYFGNMKAISIAPIIAVQKSGHKRIFDIGDIWLKNYSAKDLRSRFYRFVKGLLPFTISGKIHLDPVIVISDWLSKEVAMRYHSKQIHLVPCGIALPPENVRAISEPLTFVFAGRIEPLKGLDLVIQAAGRVVAEHQDFKVDIYGEADPDYLSRCHLQIQKLHLENHFCFKGKSTDLMNILPRYDVLLMPTMAQEALGRVIIEAMACSLIVIATDAYGPKEIITHAQNGFLFKRGSSADLAASILQIYRLDISALEKVRQAARAEVEQKYEINLVKKQIQNILENIVNET